ncbi:tyrosine-type recombinase/integrase [Burkholderia alba]|uniref:tyrosine-type recombinase/integrase n=1 Tax=Burkholderia alba TaxID=2683677 RepID=UPI002B053647|nr:tyrosine-type recombinase/integrase [Burkholderia alba]
MAEQADTQAAARQRFVLSFAYGTGLRRAELCNVRTSDLSQRHAGAELGVITVLRVVGKGAKERFVPLVPAVLDALGDYLAARGLPRDPVDCPPGTPLIPALLDKQIIQRVRAEAQATAGEVDIDAQLAARARDAGPVHPERLYRAVKRLFATAADAAQRAGTPHARFPRGQPALAAPHLRIARARQRSQSRERADLPGVLRRNRRKFRRSTL